MPRATLEDVATRAQVSKATASLVLNNREVRVTEATRGRILQAARDLQYTPNALIRSLQRNRTYTLGVYIGAGESVLNLYIGALFNAIRRAAEARDYDILVYRIGDPQKPLDMSQFLDGRVDGLIYWAGLRAGSHAELARSSIATVVLLETAGAPGLGSVEFDDLDGMRQALAHLIELGHRRVAYVAGDTRFPHLRHRLGWFEEAVRSRAERMEPVVVQVARPAMQIRSHLLETLRRPDRPTACICAYDPLAEQCAGLAEEIGLAVPDALSIVSWEDLNYPHVTRRFTSVAHRVEQLGQAAVDLLVEAISAGRAVERRQVLPVSLAVRQTTAAAANPGTQY